MAHNYTTGFFTQADCDAYQDKYLAVCQRHLNYLNNVSGTYLFAPITGLAEDGSWIVSTVEADYFEVVCSAGLSSRLSEWKEANPNAIAYVDGTDPNEDLYFNWWDKFANNTDIAAAIVDTEADLVLYQECLDEMLATVV